MTISAVDEPQRSTTDAEEIMALGKMAAEEKAKAGHNMLDHMRRLKAQDMEILMHTADRLSAREDKYHERLVGLLQMAKDYAKDD